MTDEKTRAEFEAWCKEYHIDTTADPISGYNEKTAQLWDFFRHGHSSRDAEVEGLKCCGNCSHSIVGLYQIGTCCNDCSRAPFSKNGNNDNWTPKETT